MGKFIFRLDNGSVIRSGDEGAEMLNPAKAMDRGMLSEAHLLKLQALLCEVHAKLPEEGPLKSICLGSKRSMDSVLEIGETFSGKKSRSVGGGVGTPTNAMIHRGQQPQKMAIETAKPSESSEPSPTDPNDWVAVAKKLISFLRVKVLNGGTAFDYPVDGNMYRDYYQLIEKPMYFNKIIEKLENGEYEDPKAFYDDVLLICDNCYKFNVLTYPSDFGLTGVNLENAFLKAWAKTPMAAEVPPRPLRDIPHIPKPQPATSGYRRTSSGGRVSRRGAPGAPRGRGRRPGRPPGSGFGRTKSVNSYGAQLTQAQQERLFAALQDQDTLARHMEAIVGILQAAGEVSYDEEGDLELDIQKVSPPTLAKMYQLVCGGGNSTPAPAPSGFTMDREEDMDMDDDED